MNPTKNDIPGERRHGLVALLNERLAELIDLQLQTKQAHWNVKGPTFISLHLLFDSVYEEILEFVDDVAERITALGGTAEGTLAAIVPRTKLPAYPITITSGQDHVEALSNALAAVGKRMRSSINKADEFEDADTTDLLTGISRGLDKKLWFVEAHLQGEK